MKMKRILAISILLILSVPLLRAEEPETAPAPQRKRPTVGVVLSGGGAKGMAHIGVLKMLEELDIPVDYIVGTSIGSIIGGIYALGYSASEMDSLVRAQDWDLLMKDQVPRNKIAFSYKEDNDRYILTIPFWNRNNLVEETSAGQSGDGSGTRGILKNMPGALVQGQNLDQLFTKLSVGYQDDIDFNTLPIPFACVAVDLNTKEEVVFHSGDIVTAIRASMSIPGYFNPVRIDDKYLVDGGMINNMPADVVRQMGADYVITVDLHHFKKIKPDYDQTLPEMIASLLGIMNGEKYNSGRSSSDILIEPNTSAYGVLDFDDRSVDALVDSGRVAVERVIPQLRSLSAHLKEFPDRERQRPPKAIDLGHDSVRISQLEIKGTDREEMNWLLSRTDIAPGRMVSGEDMDNAMSFFYNTRCFIKSTYAIAGNKDEGYRLKIDLEPQRIHEADLGFRFDSEEMASILLGISLNKRKLFGSKFDAEIKLGTNAFAHLRYGYTFRNLTRLNVSAQFHHMNMDVYENLAIYEEDEAAPYHFGLDRTQRSNYFRSEINYQITGWRNADIRLGARYDNMENRELSAVNFIDTHYEEQAVNGFASWRFDNMDDSYFPSRGLQIRLEGGAYYGWDKYVSVNGDTLPYHNLFYEGLIDLKAAISLGSKVRLIPQIWNRWLFGDTFSFYRNYVGGTMYGRYTETQMPFIGINNAYLTYDKVDIVRTDLLINLFRQHYLTLYANYMFDWDFITLENYNDMDSGPSVTREFTSRQNFGFGAGYSINTIVGPIQILAHWSTISRRPGIYFSLGYDF